MAIEFQCSGCSKLLRVGDEHAGGQARCPQCDTVLDVPGVSTAVSPEAAAAPPAPSSDNPFQSPTFYDRTQPAEAGEIIPTQIDVGDVLSDSWELFKKEMGILIGAVVIVAVINQVVSALANIIGSAAVEMAGRPALVVVLAVQIGAAFVQIFLTIGEAILGLNIARGRPASLGDLFAGGRWLLPVFVASLLFGLSVFLGLILLIVPGIIIALMWSQFMYLIIDKDEGIIDALTRSAEVTNGNKLSLFALYCIAFGIVILGLLACIIGVIFSAALIAVLFPVAYLKMTGQPVASVMR